LGLRPWRATCRPPSFSAYRRAPSSALDRCKASTTKGPKRSQPGAPKRVAARPSTWFTTRTGRLASATHTATTQPTAPA